MRTGAISLALLLALVLTGNAIAQEDEVLPEVIEPALVEEVIPEATPEPIAATGFDPSPFIGRGDAFNCPAFASQADAQAVLRADPRDPNRLDTDRDGIACESNRPPRDTVRVPR